jgi:hypothetical protein
MGGISISVDGDQLVALKRASDADSQARLAHEAEILCELEHPGVIRFVDWQPGPEPTLATVFVGPENWAGHPPNTLEDILTGIAELSAIVADLHTAGICHGDVQAEHVLVGSKGLPVLCGFGAAQAVSDDGRQTDRDQLLALARHLGRNLPPDQQARLHAALPAVSDPEHSFREAVRILDAHVANPPPARRWVPERQQVRHGVIAAATLVVVVVVAMTVFGNDQPASQAPTTSQAPATSQTPTTSQAPDLDTVTSTAPPVELFTGDPAISAQVVITHDGRQYGLGAEGDLVTVGDWNCDGTPTLAALRPATGEVVVFSAWPTSGATLTPSHRVIVADALEFITDSSPCPELRIRTAFGSQLVTPPRS